VRPIENQGRRGIGSLAWLLLILLARPFFYWAIGSGLSWTPHIDLLAIALPWRSDLLGRMFIYSSLSFLLAFGFFYSSLLLLSAITGSKGVPTDLSPLQRFVKLQLGWLDRLPAWMKLLLPSVAAALAWAALARIIAAAGVMPPVRTNRELWGEAGALALAALLAWKWVLILVLGFHLLNIYIYLGAHPFWSYVSEVARKLLRPLSFLSFGRVDLSPVAGIILVFVAADLGIRPWATQMFRYFMK
jgi:hypothetical protein